MNSDANTYLVLGATGGIGSELCRRLARDEANPVLPARDQGRPRQPPPGHAAPLAGPPARAPPARPRPPPRAEPTPVPPARDGGRLGNLARELDAPYYAV